MSSGHLEDDVSEISRGSSSARRSYTGAYGMQRVVARTSTRGILPDDSGLGSATFSRGLLNDTSTTYFAPSTIDTQHGEGRGLLIDKAKDSFPHLPQGPKSNDLSELTINKLNMERIGIYGRDKQLKSLNESWRSLKLQSTCRQFITISGTSGSGKTTLAYHLSSLCEKDGRGLTVRGKFESKERAPEPYSGISRACAEILGAIMALQREDPEKWTIVCKEISSALGKEITLLAEFIPVLPEVIEIEEPTSSTALAMTAAESSNRIIFAFQRFIQVVAKTFEPLIIIADDLQWADDASLDLLEALVADDSISKILLVGLYRSEEVDEEHFLKTRVDDLKSKAKKSKYIFKELEVDDLGINDIEQMILDLLQIDSLHDPDSEGVPKLAQLCKEKTLGNAFFLVQYVVSLYENKLLQFNFGRMKWSWDEQAIRLSTSACENAVQVLQRKMNQLDNDCVDVLKYAAFLGSTFNVRCLKVLWREGSKNLISDDAFEFNLRNLVAAGFLLKQSEIHSNSFAWVHDKIQEAALALIPAQERPTFARKAGETLISKLDEGEKDTSVFIIANLLNVGVSAPVDGGIKLSYLDIASWNCTAMIKAVNISAFESAAEYARNGIDLLPKDKWTVAYGVALDLYSFGAKAAGFLGHIDVMRSYCREVLAQEVGSEKDKLRIYNVMIDSMVFRGQGEEAVPIVLDVVKRYGIKLPTRPLPILLSIVKGLFSTQSAMKKIKISELKVMDDPTREQVMELMRRLNVCFYTLNDMRFPLTGFVAVKWAQEYGVCGSSAVGFAQAGIVMIAASEDYKGAVKYAEAALEIIEITSSERMLCAVLVALYLCIYPYTIPLNLCLGPLVDAYNLGLRFGDTDSATSSILHYVIYKYMSGGGLDTMTEELLRYARQMLALDRLVTYKLSRTLLQVFLNLSGRNNSDDATSMLGDALPEEAHAEAETTPMLWAALITFGGILKTFFGEHISAADDYIKHGPNCVTKIFVASHSAVLDVYLKGMSCYAAARDTKHKKYARMANKLHAIIKRWAKKGNPNVTRYDLMLNAEKLALQKRPNEAIALYEDAIRGAARSGCQQDAAFACERLGELYLYVLKNQEDAKYRLSQARGYWLSWGAVAKVAHMDRKYPKLLGPPTGEVFVESSESLETSNSIRAIVKS